MADGFDVTRMKWNMPEFRRIRNSVGMTDWLKAKGDDWVERLNAELHEAQQARKQPVADGYTYTIGHGTRARLHVFPYTARAQAHEAEHQSILKLMRMGGLEVHVKETPAQNPNQGHHVSFDRQGNQIHDLDKNG